MKCPACNNQRRNKEVKPGSWVYRCSLCEAIFGEHLYLGESYEFVLPYFAKDDVPSERLRYYEFTCLSSAGIMRRHGWYDPETKLIHQVG
jgi:hypothetical protein